MSLIMQSNSLLNQIRQQFAALRKSEQKVASYVLKHPSEAIHLSIADLALATEVSEPTVVRFCRAIGCKGFQDFKLQLAQNLAQNSNFGAYRIQQTYTPATLETVFDNTIESLLKAKNTVSAAIAEQAIIRLANSERVEFYGFGASGIVAQDAQHKLFRLIKHCAAYTDPHMQAMSAATLGPDDTVVVISQTGRTDALLQTTQLVKQASAKVIGLCPEQSPLALLADWVLDIGIQEDTDRYTPLLSRIAHLVVIDMLAMGVALTKEPGINNQLKQIKENLRKLRLNKKEK